MLNIFFLNHTRFNTPEGLYEIYIPYINETLASRLFLIPFLTPVLLYTKKDLYSRVLRIRIYEFSSSSSYSGSQQPICKVDILLIQALTIVSTPYIDVTFRFLARDFSSIRGLHASSGARLLAPISIAIYSLSTPPIRN